MPLLPDHILQTGLAFWQSKALLSAVEMGLFTELAGHPRDLDALQGQLGLHERGARAQVALGFLRRADVIYSNAPETDFYLDKAKPSYIGGMPEMKANSDEMKITMESRL